MYASLHNHSEYTNLKLRDCINRVPDMVNRAISLGFNAIALTEHEILTNRIEALEVGDKIRAEHPDFKIILGNEIYLIGANEYKNAEKYWHFVLNSLDLTGELQLRELSSRAWKRSYMERGQRRCPTFYEDIEEIIAPNKGHVVASTGCLGGYAQNRVLKHDTKAVGQFLSWCVNNFGKENFFLEMQDSSSEEQQIVNHAFLKISKQTGIPCIITQDAHYPDKESYPIFEAFLKSKEENDREVKSFYEFTYIKSEDEMKEILSYLPAEEVQRAIDNTQLIYNRVQYYDLRQDTHVPCRKLPEFKVEHLLKPWYEKYKTIEYFANSPYDQDRFLIHLIEEGIKAKNFNIGEVEAERIDTELDVLKFTSEAIGQRVSSYLNLVQEVISIMWEVSLVGVGRGSAGSWLVNFLADITAVNPLKYNIPYWRFLNKASVPVLTPEEKAAGKKISAASTLPDVDSDSSSDRALEIMQKMREHYGEDRVLNTLTYKRESLKSAILTACRGLDISSDEAKAISGMVPVNRGHVYTLAECEFGDEEKEYEAAPQVITALKSHENLYETTAKIEGIISGAGVHASAVYIFDEPVTNRCSVMRSPNNTVVTSLDYRGVDAVGGLKIDFLYTECQQKLMKCLEILLKNGEIQWQGSLKATYNKYLHPDVLDYDDPAIWSAIADNRISDLFQLSTPVGLVCVRRTKPQNIPQLGAANAVMRLMGESGKETPIDRYVRFRNDISEWYKEMDEWGLTKEEQATLEKYLLPKFGNSVEQEDMCELVMSENISNFSLGESVKFRKAVSKKKRKDIEKFKKRFFETADKE